MTNRVFDFLVISGLFLLFWYFSGLFPLRLRDDEMARNTSFFFLSGMYSQSYTSSNIFWFAAFHLDSMVRSGDLCSNPSSGEPWQKKAWGYVVNTLGRSGLLKKNLSVNKTKTRLAIWLSTQRFLPGEPGWIPGSYVKGGSSVHWLQDSSGL